MITRRIFEQVRDLIEEEALNLSHGEMLDTEIGYAEKFGVSRPTVRKAVDGLVDIGLIKRISGKGLMVQTELESINRGKLLIALPFVIGDGFMYKIFMGCVEEANILGFSYKIIATVSPQERHEQCLKENPADYIGLITCCYEDDNNYERDIVNHFKNDNKRVMLVDNKPHTFDCATITSNDYKGGYLMGEHLAKRGHTSIINIGDKRNATTIFKRKKGFYDALYEYGVKYDDSLYVENFVVEFLERFTADDFRSGKYTAICSHTTLSLIELRGFFHDNNLKIFEEVSIVGYGNHSYLEEISTPITSVFQPAANIGKEAISEMSTAIREFRPCKDIELDVSITNRHSVKRISAK